MVNLGSSSNDDWLKRAMLPNVHVGLHFTESTAEYGCPMACNVLGGERKHKYVIQLHA